MEPPSDTAIITDAEAAAKIEWRSLDQPDYYRELLADCLLD